jgi:prolyl 4-hydroxylase
VSVGTSASAAEGEGVGLSSSPTPSPAGDWPPALAPDWQDWLTTELVRGADDGALLARMVAAGFADGYARVAITVLRSMTERVRQQDPSMLADYVADPSRLPVAGTRVRVADREVRFAMVLANPNLVWIEDLLSAQECEQLIRMAQGKLRRSEVVDPVSGRLETSGVRRSEGTHFQHGENAVVARIEARVQALTGLPIANGEPLQLLHYPAGGEYEPHHDYFDPAFPGTAALLRQGGQRVATVVMYLHEPEEGGATDFPQLELSLRPRRGSAVCFEYVNQRGQLDARCLHAGMPVVRGHKWIATKWLRQAAYVSA